MQATQDGAQRLCMYVNEGGGGADGVAAFITVITQLILGRYKIAWM